LLRVVVPGLPLLGPPLRDTESSYGDTTVSLFAGKAGLWLLLPGRYSEMEEKPLKVVEEKVGKKWLKWCW